MAPSRGTEKWINFRATTQISTKEPLYLSMVTYTYTPELKRQSQEDQKLKDNLGYTVTPCQKEESLCTELLSQESKDLGL